MELTFTKDGNKWVTSFAVTSDFNIHIEKNGGRVTFYQSAVDGARGDAIDGLVMTEGDGVLDRNVVDVICPMYITIKSDVLPTMAIVTVAEGGEVGYSEAQIAETLNTPV